MHLLCLVLEAARLYRIFSSLLIAMDMYCAQYSDYYEFGMHVRTLVFIMDLFFCNDCQVAY
jgi:hypothetical protein